jgi:SAM-dependent methyltransferase
MPKIKDSSAAHQERTSLSLTGIGVSRHNDEIQNNLALWKRKPSLRKSYRLFHQLIADNLSALSTGTVVELGSGIGNIKEVIPNCVRTDLFENPWLDRVENAYALSFDNASVSDLILFDVFHHLRYPGTAFQEFYRVLMPQGRVLIFEPRISLLGAVVFGCFMTSLLHYLIVFNGWPRPPGRLATLTTMRHRETTRIFVKRKFSEKFASWRITNKVQLSAISYVTTGGYSKPSLYPDLAYPLMRIADRIADYFPSLFATRLLVVMEKN